MDMRALLCEYTAYNTLSVCIRNYIWLYVGGLCRFRGTGCRSAAMSAPQASNSLARREAVLYGCGTNLWGWELA